ncbi:MAG TPA: hypothetical protein V6C69_15885 [Trichormus sp.]|jgi:hypothetical protein
MKVKQWLLKAISCGWAVSACVPAVAAGSIPFGEATGDPQLDSMLTMAQEGDAQFDSKLWKENRNEMFASRSDMLYDLVHSEPLVGMSRKEVEGLLGQSAGSGILAQSVAYPFVAPDAKTEPQPERSGCQFVVYYEKDHVRGYRIEDKRRAGTAVSSTEFCGKWQEINLESEAEKQ